MQISTYHVVIPESQQGSEFPQLNSMLLLTFSRQCKKAKKMQINFYISEIYITVKFISHEYINIHYL